MTHQIIPTADHVLALALHELAHAIAFARQQAALCIISEERDCWRTTGLEIHKSGPEHMPSTTEITVSGAAVSHYFETDLPDIERLRLAPAAPQVAWRGSADWVSLGEEHTPESARWCLYYFLFAARYQEALIHYARQIVEKVEAQGRCVISGSELRSAFNANDPIVSQMTSLLPRVWDDDQSMAEILDTTRTAPMICAPEPTHVLAAPMETIQ